MGKTKNERQLRYREFLTKTISEQEREIIKLAVQRGQFADGATFIDEIEEKLQHRIEFRKQGQPKKIDFSQSGDRPEVSPLKTKWLNN